MIVHLFFGIITLYYVDAALLWCFNSEENYSETYLTKPLKLLSDPSFDINKTTIIYTFGFDGTPEGKDASVIISAYSNFKRQININFLMLDWEFEATGKILGSLQYPLTGIENAEKIGHRLGNALIELSKNGLNLDRVHLVGHSLGAHLMGYAGKRVQQKGGFIQRITGLDPAGPLYTGRMSLLSGLQKSDAKFVDVLHSDPYSLGNPNNLGHIDIWANCDMKIQPGCPDEFKDKCSHLRAIKYFAEAIRYPTAFPAIQSRDCGDWQTINRNHNTESKIAYLGEYIDKQLRGVFCMRTNNVSPFSRGMDGIYP